MQKLRLARLVGVAAMLGSSFAVAGGTALAGPASASNAGGGQTCNSVTLTGDISDLNLSGRIDNCGSNRGGDFTATADLTGAPSSATIHWDTGNATSLLTLQVINVDFSGGDCVQSGDLTVEATFLVTVGGGPYEGTGGVNNACAVVTGSTVVITNDGPFHI
jgi:hypothetical protein